VNDGDVARVLQAKGLATRVISPTSYLPWNICEMTKTKNRKMIITLQGGHQGTLELREGVAVVVVSPNSALLECFIFFVNRSDPWYSIRAGRAWFCPDDMCSSSEDAFVDPSCDAMCKRIARREDIDVSSAAVERIAAVHFRSERRRS